MILGVWNFKAVAEKPWRVLKDEIEAQGGLGEHDHHTVPAFPCFLLSHSIKGDLTQTGVIPVRNLWCFGEFRWSYNWNQEMLKLCLKAKQSSPHWASCSLSTLPPASLLFSFPSPFIPPLLSGPQLCWLHALVPKVSDRSPHTHTPHAHHSHGCIRA